MYLMLVETKGLSLEEVEEVFNQPNPRKYSTEHDFKLKKNNAMATA